MKAGHYENRKESVDLMIRKSREIIDDLIGFGVDFEQEDGCLKYTREGAHSCPRILFHKDITGKEITSKLLERVKERKNVTIFEYTTMTDILEEDGKCTGILAENEQGTLHIHAADTILASGGIGGTYQHSTNFPHLTGDAIRIAKKHEVRLEHLDYVQIHPTTLYSKKPGRRFLISESVRGEGAVLYNKKHERFVNELLPRDVVTKAIVLYNKKHERFVNELLPRDVVTKAIHEEMEKDGTDYVWLSMEHIPKETILGHFPNIYQRCLEEGYDVTKECIPVVPAQHYFMGGIWVDLDSQTSMHFPNIYQRCLEEGYDVTKECIPVVPAQHYFMGGIWVDLDSQTSMEHLYAVGETSCNGVHGANRLASNSLLESLVFAKRAATKISGESEKRYR